MGRVADNDEVIQLGSAADTCFSHSGAVNACIGLNFNVVLKNRWAGLLHFVPCAVFLFGEAQAVAADDGSILKDDAVSDAAEFAHDSVGVREEVIANARALVDGDETVQNGVAANVGVFSHNAVRADVCASPDFCRLCDEGCGVESRRIPGSLIEKFDGVGERQVGICRAQRGKPAHCGRTLDVDAVFHEHCGGARGLEEGKVAPIGEKSDLARFGVFDTGDSVDGSVAWTVETTAEFFGNFRKVHRHKDSSLVLSASLAQRQEGSTAALDLLVEEAWLDCGDSRSNGFSAGDTDDAEHGQLGEGRTGDKDTVGGRVQVRWSDLDTVVEHGEKIIGNYALDGLPVAVAQADPKSVQLGAAEEGLALRLEVIGEVPNEIDRAHLGEGNLLMLAVRGQKVDGIGLAEPSGIQIAAHGLFVGKDKDDFLMSRGWGSVFQRNQFVKAWNG